MRRKLLISFIVLLVFSIGFTSFVYAQDGEKVPTQTIMTATPEYDQARYESTYLIRDSLEKLGVDIDVEPMDLKVILSKIKPEPWDYDAYVKGWGSTVERIDPHFFMYNLLHSDEARHNGSNRQGHSNPEYDRLVNKAESTMDPKLRQEYLYKAQELLVEDVGVLPIYYEDKYQAYNKNRLANVEVQGGIGIINYENFTDMEIISGENTLKIGHRRDLDLLNPLSSTLYVDRQIFDLIYDYLARLDNTNEPIPSAAKDWEVEDETTVAVTLKDDLQFHDGEPLTAEDVKFTFDYGKEFGFGSLDSYVQPVKEVEVIDDTNLKFHLNKPTGYFISGTLVSIPILPKHIWEGVIEREDLDTPHDWSNPNPIGSGPYKFDHWRSGEEISLLKFDDFHTPANIDRILQIPFANPDAVIGALETGTVDIVNPELNAMQIRQVKTMEKIELVRTLGIGFTFIGYNQRRLPWSDVEFRKAVAHAIDVEEITNTVYEDYATPAGAGKIISFSNEYWHNPNLPEYETSIDKAKEVLKEAGYTWDENGKLHYPNQ